MIAERQISFWDIPVKPEDIVFTPADVAANIVRYLQPTCKCLDPCKGDGAFFNCLPEGAEWCEINDGRNFFDYGKKVDWIIGNPPYSIFETFLQHSFQLADNVSFLVPTNKIFQRQLIMEMINKWGGLRSIIIYGSGSLIGFSVGNFHFQRGYKRETKIVMGIKAISAT